MGNRVSIQFKNADETSVALFSHWGGMSFVKEAKKYVSDLKKERAGKTTMPIDRLEPDTVMVDFIRHVTQKMTRVDSDLYLAKDGNSGDNSDNGNHIVKLDCK